MYNTMKNRLARLESGAGMGGTDYALPNGAHSRIRHRDVLDAMGEAIEGANTVRAQVMLNAISASDGSRLHELCQALVNGPAPASTETIN